MAKKAVAKAKASPKTATSEVTDIECQVDGVPGIVDKICFRGQVLAKGVGNIYCFGYPHGFVQFSLYENVSNDDVAAYVGYASASVGETGCYRQLVSANRFQNVLAWLAKFDPAQAYFRQTQFGMPNIDDNILAGMLASQKMARSIFLVRQAASHAMIELSEKWYGRLFASIPLVERHKHLGVRTQ